MISKGGRSAEPAAEVYDAEYFRHNCGAIPYERSPHWLTFFERVADEIIRLFRPATVLDAGCALGLLVEALWDRGVRAEGIDISRFALANVRPDIVPHCRWGNLAEPIGGTFDVVTCIEVLEHLDAPDAWSAVANLCAAGNAVLFSSTPADFAEATHVNVCPPLVWLEAFAAHGFGPDLGVDASFLTPHAFVVRRGHPTDRATLQTAALLSRYRTLAGERLEAIAAERHQTHLVTLELADVQARLEAERARSHVEESTREAQHVAALAEIEAAKTELARLTEREAAATQSLKFAHETIARLNKRLANPGPAGSAQNAGPKPPDSVAATQLQLLETLRLLQAANQPRPRRTYGRQSARGIASISSIFDRLLGAVAGGKKLP